MRVRLTKKRLAQLDAALTLDDILYAKFRRLNEELSRRERKFCARRQVRTVVRDLGKNVSQVMQIVHVCDSGQGLEIVVK